MNRASGKRIGEYACISILRGKVVSNSGDSPLGTYLCLCYVKFPNFSCFRDFLALSAMNPLTCRFSSFFFISDWVCRSGFQEPALPGPLHGKLRSSLLAGLLQGLPHSEETRRNLQDCQLRRHCYFKSPKNIAHEVQTYQGEAAPSGVHQESPGL